MIDDILPTGEGFSEKVYKTLKWLVLIFLPGAAALYFALSNIWGWDNAEEVMGTLTAIATFLGLMIGVSQANYRSSEAAYDGNVVVETNPDTGGLVYGLEYNGDPGEIADKDQVVFKVTSPNEKFWEGESLH